MKEFLKKAGAILLAIIISCAALCIPFLFIFGAAWVSARILPWVTRIVGYALILVVLFGLPMACFRKTRVWSGMAFYFWSIPAGLQLWLASLLVALQLWGIVAAVIGIVMGGVGVIPIALLASLFKGEWSILGQLALSLIMVVAARMGGYWMAAKASQPKAVKESEVPVETFEA